MIGRLWTGVICTGVILIGRLCTGVICVAVILIGRLCTGVTCVTETLIGRLCTGVICTGVMVIGSENWALAELPLVGALPLTWPPLTWPAPVWLLPPADHSGLVGIYPTDRAKSVRGASDHRTGA